MALVGRADIGSERSQGRSVRSRAVQRHRAGWARLAAGAAAEPGKGSSSSESESGDPVRPSRCTGRAVGGEKKG